MNGLPPTDKQLTYIRGLQHQLHLTNALLDAHCVKTFGVVFGRLDRRQASDLIETLKEWTEIPAEMRRAAGQADLPGFGAAS